MEEYAGAWVHHRRIPFTFKLTTDAGEEVKVAVYEYDHHQKWISNIREAAKRANDKVM